MNVITKDESIREIPMVPPYPSVDVSALISKHFRPEFRTRKRILDFIADLELRAGVLHYDDVESSVIGYRNCAVRDGRFLGHLSGWYNANNGLNFSHLELRVPKAPSHNPFLHIVPTRDESLSYFEKIKPVCG